MSLKNGHENPVMTCPIQKRINTELFIDGRTELCIKRGAHKNMGYIKK